MADIYELDLSKKIYTKHIAFYRKLKDNDVIQSMHQLFTYACLVGIKEGKKSEGSKPTDICTIGNIDETNLKVVKGILLMKSEPADAEELLKEMQDYADYGLEVLMRDYDNEKMIRLDKYL